MAYKGPDISKWNGDIDIKKLATQVDFFIFRGYASNKDIKVDRNVQLCIEVGKPYGLYLYSYALNTSRSKEEAEKLVNLANSYSVKPNFLVIDMEDADGYKRKHGMPSNQVLKDICLVACEIFEKAGYKAVIYASSSWFKNQLIGLNQYEKWIAHWPTKNGKQLGNAVSSDGENADNCAIWQFTSEGRLEGYDGRLDMNYAYKDFVIKGYDKPQPTPQPAKKSIDEIAREVIAGKWGNGEDRKNRLEEAGYNYREVQDRVNKLLSESKDIYYKACDKKYKSIVDALNSIGVNSSFEYRKKIAIKNKIYNYSGTAVQNNQLLTKLKAGRLLKI